MTDFASRLDIIEARFAISELRSQYCWYTTRGLRDEVVGLFTDDCIFQNSRNAHDEPITVTGKAGLREYLSKMKPGRRVPMVMNEIIKVNGDEAEGTCVMQSIGEDGFCGHYIDEFRRVDGRWLFSVRRFYPYWPIFKPDADRRDP
jgi:hypothetical protein